MKVKSVRLWDSIAYNLLRVVFAIYLFFAVSITGYHMYLDYQTAEQQIVEQLGLIEKAFEDSLSTALFDLDAAQLQSILEGLHEMHTLIGVNLYGSNPDIFIPDAAIGVIADKNKAGTVKVDSKGVRTQSTVPFDKLIRYDFTLYQPGTNSEIARGELYSSSDIVFSTVESSFIRLVISAAVKTGLLWLLFLWAATGKLSLPLRQFAADVARIDMSTENIKVVTMEKKSSRYDEMAVLSQAFQLMQERINEYITALRKEKSEVEASRFEAEIAHKAKTEFLSTMSHELLTPMNAIIGMSELTLKTDLDSKQRNYIEKSKNSADSLLSLIHQILDYADIEKGSLEVNKHQFNFNQLIQSFKNKISVKADKKQQSFTISIAKEIPFGLNGDAKRLEQVLLNLADNAVKFTETGGKIEVDIKLEEQNSALLELYFSISDTGLGITDEQQKTLFQPFKQVDGATTREFGGTGIGLMVAKQLIEKMGGKIWVESEYGIGSTFNFTVLLEKLEIQPEQIQSDSPQHLVEIIESTKLTANIDKTAVTPLLQELLEFVSNYDLDAEFVLEKLQPLLIDTNYNCHLEKITRFVQNYNFDEALEEVKSLSAELQ